MSQAKDVLACLILTPLWILLIAAFIFGMPFYAVWWVSAWAIERLTNGCDI